MIDEEITKYDIAYRDVLCTGVKWRYPENDIFYFTKDGKNYEFEQKYYIDNQSADTDHIRCVIVDQFLPWWKNERIKELEAENAELKARLENAVELKAKVGDTIYLPWIYDGNFDIASLLITGIYFKNDEFQYITNLKSDSAIYLAKYEYGIFRNQDFDNIVFTDRIAAEARLAELKGGRNEDYQ